jgi:copper homeostasis protein
MPRITLEVCVDSAEGLAQAITGGADRIELCAALALGGLTATPGLMALAAKSPVPVYPMIRPRDGDFVFDEAETDTMLTDIAHARAMGFAGIVIGANRVDGTLDLPVLARLIAAARGLDVTLHRAFDLVPDMDAALDQVIALGIPRILTSGGAVRAVDGIPALRRLMDRATGRVIIMPGSGVTPHTIAALRHLPLQDIHASCAVARPQNAQAVRLGFTGAERRETQADTVRMLKSALAH